MISYNYIQPFVEEAAITRAGNLEIKNFHFSPGKKLYKCPLDCSGVVEEVLNFPSDKKPWTRVRGIPPERGVVLLLSSLVSYRPTRLLLAIAA